MTPLTSRTVASAFALPDLDDREGVANHEDEEPNAMTIGRRAREWWDVLKSFGVALRASGLFGRSIKLRRAGRNAEALAMARRGLAILASPGVRRQVPPESACLVSLTIQVEQLSRELGEPGASWRDIVDVCNTLRAVPEEARGDVGDARRTWLPYFESRLGGPETVH